MRKIGVVSVARSDYGIYKPILNKIQKDSELDLYLMVSGMHHSPEFGMTVRDIESDGFTIGDQFEMLLSSDSPEGVAKSVGLGTVGFAQSFSRFRPDILLVLGDRFEMLSAVVASLPFKIPVAHLHGGESTEGLIDEPIRHSITKMSHLHFVSTDVYAKRVIQMGEEPWRVYMSGAPSLDNLNDISLLDQAALHKQTGLDLKNDTLLVTYHPVTLEYEHTAEQVNALLKALEETGQHIIFTYPNADTQGRLIIEMIQRFVARYNKAQIATNLGTQAYFSLMNCASAMIGNSSSGIIEAASFELPVVNIGNRQRGRVHGLNVLDVGYEYSDILNGIRQVTSAPFRDALKDLKNPYGYGQAAELIVNQLKIIELDDRLLMKRFHDLKA